MTIDIIVAILLGWALLRGWLRGFVYQLGQLAALVGAVLAGRGLGPLVEPSLHEALAGTPGLSDAVSFFLVFVVAYTACILLVHMLTRDLHRASRALTAGDRFLGLVLGGAKGALTVYVVFLGLIVANQATGAVPVPYASSHTGRWVMQHNVLEAEDFPRAKALTKLGLLVHRQSATVLMTNPHFRAVMSHPKAAVLRTPETARALAQGDWLAVVGDEAVWDLLDEPEIQEHLNAIELGEASTGAGGGAL